MTMPTGKLAALPPAETRVLYEVLDDQVVVAVFRVAHRREAYRD